MNQVVMFVFVLIIIIYKIFEVVLASRTSVTFKLLFVKIGIQLKRYFSRFYMFLLIWVCDFLCLFFNFILAFKLILLAYGSFMWRVVE